MGSTTEKFGFAIAALVLGLIGGAVFGNVGFLNAQTDGGGGDSFHAVGPPVRILDTRVATGITAGNPVQPQQTLPLPIAGTTAVPADATAVQLNVTVVDGSTASFLTVWDDGPWPGTSSLNWDSPSATSNSVTTAIGADGSIRFYNNSGTVHLVVDITGYYTEGAALGATNFETISESFPQDLGSAGETAGESVTCPAGKGATGGGVSITDNNGLDIRRSIPSGQDGWTGGVTAESPPFTGTMNIWVICASNVLPAPTPTP